MTQHFQKEIERVKKEVLHLTAMVEENLRDAVTAVTEGDDDLARQVIARDDEIDQFEVELEESLLKILALHQPVAIDLRFIIATLKIDNDLERIGDLAVNIAKRTTLLDRFKLRHAPFDLSAMLGQAVDMVKMSADALVDMDPELAKRVLEEDDKLDDYHRAAYDATLNAIKENPESAGNLILLVGISRNLERIGDHATNIAEDVYYMVTGDIIRHRS